MEKTPIYQTANLGDSIAWQVKVKNDGFGTARNVTLSDRLALGMEFVGFSVAPTNANPLTLHEVAWDASVLPALAAVAAGQSVSVWVTGRVVQCQGGLYNLADATYGCKNMQVVGDSVCEDTRLNDGTALAVVLLNGVRPVLEFTLTPTNAVLPYCEGLDFTLSITNLAVPYGATVDNLTIETQLVPGYRIDSVSGGALVGGNLLLGTLPFGSSTQIVAHLVPGGRALRTSEIGLSLRTPEPRRPVLVAATANGRSNNSNIWLVDCRGTGDVVNMLSCRDGAGCAVPNLTFTVHAAANTPTGRTFMALADARLGGTVCAHRPAYLLRRRARRTNGRPAPPKSRRMQPGWELRRPALFSLDRMPSRCQSLVKLPGPPTPVWCQGQRGQGTAKLPPAAGTPVAKLTPQINVPPNMNETAGRKAQPRQNLPPLPPAAQWAAGEVGARQLSTTVCPGTLASAGCSLDPTTTVNTSPNIFCP